MNIWENIKLTFKRGNVLTQLIYVNVGVFVLLKAIAIILLLFNMDSGFIISWLAVPADLSMLLRRFWTPVSYMFLHEGFFHLFFNMLCLYWFGRIFLSVFSERHLVGLYFVGGLVAALFYIVSYNVFPYYASLVPVSILLGASGSIMAIIVASATKLPNMEIRLFLLGGIKLKYIAIASVLVSFFGITSANGGGELAHLGGALTGYLFIILLNKGTDITGWMNKILDGIVTVFRPKKMKVRKVKKNTTRPNTRMSDEEYNMNKARNMAEIDRILDKIKESGYESLTAEEKRRLFEQERK